MALTLYCFPHAGGSANAYYGLKRLEAVLPGLTVNLCEYPGRGRKHREPCMRTMAALTDVLTGEILAENKGETQATVLFGHSMGAFAALEVAKRLEASPGFDVRAVIASGQTTPFNSNSHHSEKNDEQLIAYLKALGGIPPIILEHPDYLSFFLAPVRADMALLDAYEPAKGADCQKTQAPVHVFYGVSDPEIALNKLSDWQQVSARPINVRAFAGGHFYLFEHLRSVEKAIGEILAVCDPPFSEEREDCVHGNKTAVLGAGRALGHL